MIFFATHDQGIARQADGAARLVEGKVAALHSSIGRLNRVNGLTIVMVTHDEAIAWQADRVVSLARGIVERS